MWNTAKVGLTMLIKSPQKNIIMMFSRHSWDNLFNLLWESWYNSSSDNGYGSDDVRPSNRELEGIPYLVYLQLNNQ